MKSNYVYIVLALILLFQTSFSLIVDKTVTPQKKGEPRYAKVEKFGMAVGGNITIAGRTTAKNSFIYICNEKEYEMRTRLGNWISWLCDSDHSTGIRVPLDGAKREIPVKTQDIYYFTVVDCAPSYSDWEAVVSYDLRSTKSGDHLSLGDIPLPIFYMVLNVYAAILLTVWLIVVIPRCPAQTTPIHYIMLLVLVLKLVVITAINFYWWMYYKEGIRYDIMDSFKSFLFAMSETSFFCAIYLIAKGWRISRPGLPAAELRSTCLCLFILLCTLLFFSFYNTEYYWLGLIAMYFFLLPKLFSSISQNIYSIDSQQMLLRRAPESLGDMQPHLNVLAMKRTLFVGIRTSIMVYLVSILLINSLVKALMAWEYVWVTTVLNDSIMVLTVAYACYCVGPCKPALFLYSNAQMRPLLGLLRYLEAYEEEEHENVKTWDLSKTIVVSWPHEDKNHNHFSLAHVEEYLMSNEAEKA